MSRNPLQAIAHHVTLRELAEAMRALVLLPVEFGTVIAEEGMEDPNLIHVLTGGLEAVHGAIHLGSFPSGSTIGQECLFGDGKWAATVKATEPSVLLVASSAIYERLRQTGNPVAGALERGALAQQIALLRELDARIAALAIGDDIEIKRPSAGFFRRFRAGGGPVSPSVGVTALRGSPLFRDAHPDAVRRLTEHMSAHTYRAGELIAAQGQTSDKMYFLAEGKVDVLLSTTGDLHEPLGVLGAGTVFGMTSLLEDRPHMASVVAKEQVLLYALDRDTCQRVVDSDSEAGGALRRALLRALVRQTESAVAQVARLDKWMKDRVHEEVNERLYRTRAVLGDALESHGASRLEAGDLVIPS